MRNDEQNSLPWEEDKKVRVAIIGDVMVDEYLEGEVNRISPEAPVPVHLVKKSRLAAGGAANVARNIQLVGGEAKILSVWGDDETASKLEEILRMDNIDTSCIITDPDRPTVKKTRLTSKNNQLVRIDWEKATPISLELQNQILEKLKALSVQVILLSDYGKGCLTKEFLKKLIQYANAENIPVIVDPKGYDYSGYAGAHLITPNRKEACDALGVDTADPWDKGELAAWLQKKYGLKNILLTLGPHGMYFHPEEDSSEKSLHLKANAREVYDVSGAGDTVIAIMSLAIAASCSIPKAMRLANVAAGIVIEKWGTQPILKEELKDALAHESALSASGFSTTNKMVDVDGLQTILEMKYPDPKRVVFTNGCFDLLHAGHVTYLEQARSKGEVLVVGINTDSSIQKLKGKNRPIVPLKYRMRLLAALSCVDYVVAFNEETPLNLIQKLKPDVLVKGADYEIEHIVGADFVLKRGGAVERLRFVDGLSTTSLVKKIKSLT